jgi:hypothetical protein
LAVTAITAWSLTVLKIANQPVPEMVIGSLRTPLAVVSLAALGLAGIDELAVFGVLLLLGDRRPVIVLRGVASVAKIALAVTDSNDGRSHPRVAASRCADQARHQPCPHLRAKPGSNS